ncbi:MAG: hypothetical protein KJO42_03100 [Silicimonas sp.]|nr:hypothetical protein [Silicimonas sp.]
MTWAALFLWPLVAVVLFKTLRLPVALLVTIIGGYLILPTRTAFDLPLLPSLDKQTVPVLAALLGVLLFSGQRQVTATDQTPALWPVQPGFMPRNKVAFVLLLVIVFGLIGTHMTNADVVIYGYRVLPALRPYDAMSAILSMFLVLLPFFLARKVLASRDGQVLLLKALAVAAVAYTFLALYEIRMSPQINRMVYGFFQHDFGQHFRNGGWRPVVFLDHGLQLGIFWTTAVISAACLVRITSDKERLIWLLLMFWLLGVLFLSKVLGAQLICIAMLGVVFFLPRHLQILAAVFIISCFLIYPVLRVTNLLPFDLILSNVDPWRAYSLQYRLDNEQLLLEKANERPLFGWGGWGRSRVYTDWGDDIATTDGAWVIQLGLSGWVGYIGYFGLMCWGVLSLLWQRREGADLVSVALALALTAMIADFVPNTNSSPVTWLLAGSLIGRLETARHKSSPSEPAAQEDAPPARDIRYAREGSEVVLRSKGLSQSPDRKALPYRREFGKARP